MSKGFAVAGSLLLFLAGIVVLPRAELLVPAAAESPSLVRLTQKLAKLAFSSGEFPRGELRPLTRSYVWTAAALAEQWRKSEDENGITLISPKLAFRNMLEFDSLVIRLSQGGNFEWFTVHWSDQPELTREVLLQNRREFTLGNGQEAQAFVLRGDDISDVKFLGRLEDEQAPAYLFLRSPKDLSFESVEVHGKRSRFAMRPAGLDRQNLQGDIRDALYFITPGSVSFTGQIPAAAQLIFGVHSLLRDAEPVQYRVLYRDGRGEVAVLDEVLPETGSWRDFRVSLPAPAVGPQPVEAILTLEARTSEPGNVVFFANPIILPPNHVQRPNVVLYVVDALRADHLGAYGYLKPTSPYLDRLARRGQVFERCFAPASWTKPSIASLFTSLYPGTHGVGAKSHADTLPDSVETLADYFRGSGYVTASFSANPLATTLSNLDQGFDYVFTPNAFSADQSGSKEGKVGSDDLNAHVLPWIEEHHDEPFFLYIHSLDPHRPYSSRSVPGPLAGGTDDIDRYDREIHLNDREIERVHKKLEQLGLTRRTLFIVTSDHGESFGEHGRQGHGNGVYREEIHIPLIMAQPGSIFPRRVAEPAHLVDLMPTILKHCGIPFEGNSMEGVDLLGGAKDRLQSRTVFSQRFTYPENMEVEDFRGVDSYAVIRDGWKLIVKQSRENETPQVGLYALDKSEADQNDQTRPEADTVEELHGELAGHLAEQREKRRAFIERHQSGGNAQRQEPLSAETIERLRSLGYIK